MLIADVLARAKPHVPVITLAARKYRVDPSLLMGVAAAESAFDPRAHRDEPQLGTASYGLFQLLETTARAIGFTADRALLYHPAVSAELGAKLLRMNIDRAAGYAPQLEAREIEDRALSAYNAGWSRERPGDGKRIAGGRAFVNQEYVDRVRRWQLRLRQLGVGAILAIAIAGAVVAVRLLDRAENFSRALLETAAPRSPDPGDAALVPLVAAGNGGR